MTSEIEKSISMQLSNLTRQRDEAVRKLKEVEAERDGAIARAEGAEKERDRVATVAENRLDIAERRRVRIVETEAARDAVIAQVEELRKEHTELRDALGSAHRRAENNERDLAAARAEIQELRDEIQKAFDVLGTRALTESLSNAVAWALAEAEQKRKAMIQGLADMFDVNVSTIERWDTDANKDRLFGFDVTTAAAKLEAAEATVQAGLIAYENLERKLKLVWEALSILGTPADTQPIDEQEAFKLVMTALQGKTNPMWVLKILRMKSR